MRDCSQHSGPERERERRVGSVGACRGVVALDGVVPGRRRRTASIFDGGASGAIAAMNTPGPLDLVELVRGVQTQVQSNLADGFLEPVLRL